MCNGDIQVNPVIIDKLAFTVNVDEDCKDGITSMICDSISDYDSLFLPTPRERRISGYRFTYQFELDASQNSYCTISIALEIRYMHSCGLNPTRASLDRMDSKD